MSGLVNASLSLPEWQAVKMFFFHPFVDEIVTCYISIIYWNPLGRTFAWFHLFA